MDGNAFLGSVLVAEDDLVLSRFYRMALGDLSREVVVATGPEAARLLEARPFDFLITDLKMAGKDGRDIVHCAVKHSPAIRILVASGYVSDVKYGDFLREIPNVRGFLQKPFTIETLCEKLKALAEEPTLTV